MKKLNIKEIKLPRMRKVDKVKVIDKTCKYPKCEKEVYRPGAKFCLEHKRESKDIAKIAVRTGAAIAGAALTVKKIIK